MPEAQPHERTSDHSQPRRPANGILLLPAEALLTPTHGDSGEDERVEHVQRSRSPPPCSSSTSTGSGVRTSAGRSEPKSSQTSRFSTRARPGRQRNEALAIAESLQSEPPGSKRRNADVLERSLA